MGMYRFPNPRDAQTPSLWIGESVAVTAVWYSGKFAGTAANWMLAGGAKVEQISLVLGHSSLEVTKKYLGVDLDLQNAATDKIGLVIQTRQERLTDA